MVVTFLSPGRGTGKARRDISIGPLLNGRDQKFSNRIECSLETERSRRTAIRSKLFQKSANIPRSHCFTR